MNYSEVKSLCTQELQRQYPDYKIEILWAKKVTGLNKKKVNGYSLEGDFLSDHYDEEDFKPGLGVIFVLCQVQLEVFYCDVEYKNLFQGTICAGAEHKGSAKVDLTAVGIGLAIDWDGHCQVEFTRKTSRHAAWAKPFWKLLSTLLARKQPARDRIPFLEKELKFARDTVQELEGLLAQAKAELEDESLTEWLQTAAVLGGNRSSTNSDTT